jgi:spore coat protein CotH
VSGLVSRARLLRLLAPLLLTLPGCGGGAPAPAPTTAPLVVPPVPPPVATTDVFAEDVLHYVELTVLPEDLALLVPGSDERVRCTLVYDGVQLDDVGVRLKGGLGSLRPVGEKPGFSFKTNEFVKGRALHGVKKLTLNNAVQDPSLLSEVMAYEIWRRAGALARRAAHARVTLNGEYLGVYVATESYEGPFLGRSFPDDSGNLYEGSPGVDLTDVDTLELDTQDDQDDRSDLRALAAVLEAAPDEAFPSALEDVLEVDAYLRYWAVEALLHHWDGYAAQNKELHFLPGPNNYFVYHDPSRGRFTMLPWGADRCFERADAPVLATPQGEATLAARCFAHPELRARYVEHVRAALEAWDPLDLEARAVAAYERVAGSAREGDQDPAASFERFLAGVDAVRAFLRTRPEIVAAELARAELAR